MAKYDPLDNHTVQTRLNSLFKLRENSKLDPSNSALDPTHQWALERVFSVAREAQLTIEKLGREELNLAALDGISASIHQITSELNAYLANNNTAHLNNARNQVESSVLVNVKRLLPIGFPVHPQTEAALERYKANFSRTKTRFEKEQKELRAEAEQLRSNLAEQNAMLASAQKEVSATRAENEALLSDLRQADISRVEAANSEAKEALVKREQSLGTFLTRQKSKVSSTLDKLHADGSDTLQSLRNKRDEASQLVQSVGDLLTTGTYADRASKETAKADQFRYITISLFGIGLLIIISNYLVYAIGSAFVDGMSLAESWQSLLVRVTTGAAVTIPAFYTARESARHRTNADIAKQRELELTTLGPFIELLPDAQKAAIRDRLTDRYFGNDVPAHEIKMSSDAEAVAQVLKDTLKVKDDGSG